MTRDQLNKLEPRKTMVYKKREGKAFNICSWELIKKEDINYVECLLDMKII